MAARLLARSRTQTLARVLHPSSSSPIDPLSTSSQCLRSLHSLTSQRPLGWSAPPPPDSRSMPSASIPRSDLLSSHPGKIWGCGQSFSHWYYGNVQGGGGANHKEKGSSLLYHSAGKESMAKTVGRIAGEGGECDGSKVTCFSPLEAGITKKRTSALELESLKLDVTELSQHITYTLILPLLLISKWSLTTSFLIFSVYWQVYGFFKEIFLDYVHHEVTRKWVLIYFKLLLLILVKDTILDFDLV